MNSSTTGSTLRITLLYFGIGSLWVLGSDLALHHLTTAPRLLTYLGLLKNGAFVAVTALLLHLLLRRKLHQQDRHDAQPRDVEERIRLLTTAVGAAANGIVVTDRNARITWVNPAFTRLTGYTVEEVLGQTPRVLKSGKHEDAFYRNLWETILAGQVWQGETINRRKDGSLYTEEQTITPLRDEHGILSHFIAIKQDVTARKQAEEALRRYAARLETLRAIDRAILAAHSPQEIAEAALHHVCRLVSCQWASIAVFNRQAGMVTLLGVNAEGETRLGPGTRWPLDQFPGMETLRYGRMAILEDLRGVAAPSPPVQALVAEGIRTLTCVPLTAEGELIGSLNVGAKRPDAFTPEDREIISEVADQLAVAIQQARLHATAVQRGEELGALLRAIRSIMSGLDLPEILERIVEEAAGISHCPHVKVLLVDRANGVLRTMAAQGTAMSFGGELPIGTGLSGLVATSGQVLFVPDCLNDPRNPLAGKDREMGLVTYLGLPIVAHEEVVGVLTFNTTTSRQYNRDELAYLTSFADQAAIAIEHAQLFSAQQRAAQEARSLYEVARSLTTSLNVQEVLDLIVRKTMDLIGTAHAQVALWDEATQTLRLGAVRGTQAEQVRSHRWHLGEGVNGNVAATRAPLVVNDYQHFPHRVSELADLTADIGVPLLYRGRLLGVLNSHSTEPGWTFTQEHMDLLTTFAHQAAVALENARLYEQLQRHVAELEQRVQERTQELAVANQQLRDASRHKSELLANMSHEIRTPLNSILGFSQLLQEQTRTLLSEKQTRYLGHIYNSGQHLLQLINDILDISKVEAGKFVLHLEPLAVPQILEDILVLARGLAKKKSQEVQTDIAPDIPPLFADPLRFKQILFNLLSNAVKFTPDGGRITLTARQNADFKLQSADLEDGDPAPQSAIIKLQSEISGGFLEIKVHDTGVGIRPEGLPKLFREFVQLETSQAQKHEGSGLGLALTRKLVELHGGRIWAKSEGEGRGSVFTFIIPFTGPTIGRAKSQGSGFG